MRAAGARHCSPQSVRLSPGADCRVWCAIPVTLSWSQPLFARTGTAAGDELSSPTGIKTIDDDVALSSVLSCHTFLFLSSSSHRPIRSRNPHPAYSAATERCSEASLQWRCTAAPLPHRSHPPPATTATTTTGCARLEVRGDRSLSSSPSTVRCVPSPARRPRLIVSDLYSAALLCAYLHPSAHPTTVTTPPFGLRVWTVDWR